MEDNNVRTYDPLDRNTFTALSVNAVGRASEVVNANAFTLAHSTGNSGKSIGFLQTDLGQRRAVVNELIGNYQEWATTNNHNRFSEQEVASLTQRLGRSGQTGNALTAKEAGSLNAYLSSNEGRTFISELDDRQATRLWDNVGQPLNNIDWMQTLRENDPEEAALIITRAMKLFNQNETRGTRLVNYLSEDRDVALSSQEVGEWILNNPTQGLGINGLRPEARAAITSGQGKAISGAEVFNEIITSDGNIGELFRNTIGDNPHLIPDNNTDIEMLLLDKIFRNSSDNSILIVNVVDNELDNSSRKVFVGTTESSRIEVNRNEVIIRDLDGVDHNVIEMLNQNSRDMEAPPLSLNTGNETVDLLLANLENSKDNPFGFDLDVMMAVAETKEGKEFTDNLNQGVEEVKIAEASLKVEQNVQVKNKESGIEIG